MSKSILSPTAIPNSEADTLIGGFADASWRQCPGYAAAAAEQIGADSEYVKLVSGDSVVALANVRIKKLPGIGTGIALISHGPMCVKTGQAFNAEIYRQVLQALSKHYTLERKLALRVEPHIYDERIREALPELFARAGFNGHGGGGYQTFMIDLAPDTETLRKNLNGKWRTDLNRGERGDLRITRSSDASDFDLFAPMLEELAHKKGFSAPQGTAFFKRVAAAGTGSDNIIVHLAWGEDEVIGGHIGAFSGDTAVYLLGATTDAGRDQRAAFVLQWAVMEYAKSIGQKRYDLGGVDENDNPAVHRFKKRMGGYFVETRPAFEKFPPQPYKFIVKSAEAAYRRLKG